ncbi:MAG TPA: peptidoglycan DD-metalloendopeptidase family protein [Burkholderiales bacterium]|nr:peptidoglycan DD-metalloendopeptidase family protein [Burkholderiales bacterium]
MTGNTGRRNRLAGTRFLAQGFAALALLGAVPAPAVQAATTNRNTAKADSEDLRELRGRIEALRGDIASKEETRSEARDALRESERAISEANRRLRSLAEEQQAAKVELNRIGNEESKVEAELAARQDILGRVLMARYLGGNAAGGEADYFKLLLTGRDPNETTRNLHYYTYISRAQAALVRAQRQNLDRLRDLEGQARDKNRELAGIEADRKTERDRLAKEQAGRRQVLDKVSAEIRDKKQRMKTLERDETRLTRLVEELGKVLAAKAARDARGRAAPRDKESPPGSERGTNVPESAVVSRAGTLGDIAGSPFDRLKGSLRLPVRGELVNRFGSPRSDGGPSWKGLFIRAPGGQEVRAVAGGRVVFAEWMRGFGNLVILDHGRAYLSIYGNNESVLRQVGDVVKTGDAVATTGASGGNTDSGLYFELRHEGRAVDPLKWVTLK